MNPSTPLPLDDEERALRAALASGAPEPNEKMRAALAAFRERLPRHGVVRRMERAGFWQAVYLLRRGLRYASLAVLCAMLCASLTASGRAVMVRGAGWAFRGIEDFVKARVEAGYSSFELFWNNKSGRYPITPDYASVQQFLGIEGDGRMIMVVRRGEVDATDEALWAVDPATGRLDILRGRIAAGKYGLKVFPVYGTGAERRLQAVTFLSLNTGFVDFMEALWTGEPKSQALWFCDLKHAPQLIDDGENISSVVISPDLKRIAYHKSHPDPASVMWRVTVFNRETGEQKTLHLNDTSYFFSLAFSPRGDSLICREEAHANGANLTRLVQVDLARDKITASVDLPPGRTFHEAVMAGGDTLLLVHCRVIKTSENKYERTDCQVEPLALDPLRRLTAAPIPMAYGASLAAGVVRISPDGRYALCTGAGNDPPNVIELRTGRKIATFQQLPYTACWSPDSKSIAGTYYYKDQEPHEVSVVYSLASGKLERKPFCGIPLGWIDNERMAYSAHYRPLRIRVRNEQTGKETLLDLNENAL